MTVIRLLRFSFRLIFATTKPRAQETVMTKTEISAVSRSPPSRLVMVNAAWIQ